MWQQILMYTFTEVIAKWPIFLSHQCKNHKEHYIYIVIVKSLIALHNVCSTYLVLYVGSGRCRINSLQVSRLFVFKIILSKHPAPS